MTQLSDVWTQLGLVGVSRDEYRSGDRAVCRAPGPAWRYRFTADQPKDDAPRSSQRSARPASACVFVPPIHTAQADAVGSNMQTMFFGKLVQRIREEFDEAPGLCLSLLEAARFWALDLGTCERVLTELLGTGFLTLGVDDRYRQAASHV